MCSAIRKLCGFVIVSIVWATIEIRQRHRPKEMDLNHEYENNFETIIFFPKASKSIKIHICRLRAMHTKLPKVFDNHKYSHSLCNAKLFCHCFFFSSFFTKYSRKSARHNNLKRKKCLLDFHLSFQTKLRCFFLLHILGSSDEMGDYSSAFFLYRLVSENGSWDLLVMKSIVLYFSILMNRCF